jgi:hypothetical protein
VIAGELTIGGLVRRFTRRPPRASSSSSSGGGGQAPSGEGMKPGFECVLARWTTGFMPSRPGPLSVRNP